jgi:hypothetical protein
MCSWLTSDACAVTTAERCALCAAAWLTGNVDTLQAFAARLAADPTKAATEAATVMLLYQPISALRAWVTNEARQSLEKPYAALFIAATVFAPVNKAFFSSVEEQVTDEKLSNEVCARAGIVLRLQGPQRFSATDAVPALLGFLKLRMPPATVLQVLQTRAQRASNRRVAFAALEELLGRCNVPALRLELLRACAAACRGLRGLHFLEDVSVRV